MGLVGNWCGWVCRVWIGEREGVYKRSGCPGLWLFVFRHCCETLGITLTSSLAGLTHEKDKMGKTGIRTVCKVDFDTPASEQPYLHVSAWFWVV